MAIDPDNLYMRLGYLIASMPALARTDTDPTEIRKWLGQAYALVYASGDIFDATSLKSQASRLRTIERSSAASEIATILFRTLATAELNASAGMQGAFIPAGNVFEAMAVLGKVLQSATQDVLIVDPYMDEKALTDFAVLIPEGIMTRLLADQKGHKPTLKPAVTRWHSEHGTARPLDARLAPGGSLHDRLIAIDGVTAWVLTQSLNGLAVRSPASVLRSDADTAKLKIMAYESIWRLGASI